MRLGYLGNEDVLQPKAKRQEQQNQRVMTDVVNQKVVEVNQKAADSKATPSLPPQTQKKPQPQKQPEHIRVLRERTDKMKKRGNAAQAKILRLPPGLANKPELAARWEAKKAEITQRKKETEQKAEVQLQAWGRSRPVVAMKWAEEDIKEEAEHAQVLEQDAATEEAEQALQNQRLKNVPEQQRAALQETWARQQLDKKEQIAARELERERRKQEHIQSREEWQETKDKFYNFFAPMVGWQRRVIP